MRAVLLYRRGSRWDDGRPLGEQRGLDGHMAFLAELAREGVVELAGPFHRLDEHVPSDLVGLVVVRGDELAEARALADRDPAVREGTLAVEALPWYLGRRRP